jgi:hypothetical protein
MRIEYRPFSGMRPAVDTRVLDKSEATEAVNCDLRYQTVKPFLAPDTATLSAVTRVPLGYDVADPQTTDVSHLHDILHNVGGSIPEGLYEVNERGTYVAASVVAQDAHERVYFTRPAPDGGIYDRGRTDGTGAFEERAVGVAAPVDPDLIAAPIVSGRSTEEQVTDINWGYYIEEIASPYKQVETGVISPDDIELTSLVDDFGNEVQRYRYKIEVGDASHPLTSYSAEYVFIMYGEMTSEKGRFLGTVYPEPSVRKSETTAYVGGTLADASMAVTDAPAPLYDYCDIKYTPASEDYSHYRSYLFTYVTDRGEESAPSATTDPVAVLPSDKVTLSIDVTNRPTNSAGIRLYRTETTDAGTAFFFVNELLFDTYAPPVLSYTDLMLAVDLDGDTLQTLKWAAPPSGLRGLVLSTKGFYAGYVGSKLYLSESFVAYAWPDDYAIDFTGDITHVTRYGDTLAVFTDREIALIVGNTPLEVRKIKVEGFEVLTSIYSTTETDGLLYFATPVGIAAISGTNVAMVTDELIAQRWWRDNIDVQETRIVSFDNALYMLSGPDGDTYRIGLQAEEGGFIRLGDPLVRDLYTSSFYLGVSFLLSAPEGDAYIFDTGTAGNRTVSWRGRTEVAGIPMAVISVRALGETYPITFRVYEGDDAVPQLELTLTSDKIRKLPVMRRGREWSFEIEGTGNIVSLEIGTSGRLR